MKIHGRNVARALSEIAAQPQQIQMMVREFVDLVEKSDKYLPECAMALALESHTLSEEAMHKMVKHLMDRLSSDFGAMHQDFDDHKTSMKERGCEWEAKEADKMMVRVLTSQAEILGIAAAFYLQGYMARMEQLMESDEEVAQ